MEYGEFIKAYRDGRIRFGIERSRVKETATSEMYQHLFAQVPYSNLLNRLATVLSTLVISFLIAALILPFVTAWWFFIPCLMLALFFSRMSYRYQREAIRELALADPTAYKLLFLQGIIVISE